MKQANYTIKRLYCKPTIKKTLGWLVVAVALTIGMAACSSDDSVIAENLTPQEPTQTATKIHVTVGAGISDNDDDATTRSAVDALYHENTGKTTRTLTFTAPVGNPGDANYSPGDRLYIIGDIESNVRTMGGLLTMKSISSDGKSATFEGDLTVQKKDGQTWSVDTEWAASQEGDPMTWYGENSIKGWLIHAATADNAPIYKYGTDGSFRFYYEYSLVTGDGDLVNKLMESAIEVQGYYNETNKCFKLWCDEAIFNCTISGLAANTAYFVCFAYASSEDEYNSQNYLNSNTYTQSVTTDVEGTTRFAIGTENIGPGNHGILLCTDKSFNRNKHNVFDCIIEHRSNLETKVYNLNRYWTGTTFEKNIDLSKLQDNYEAQDGDALTGTLVGNYKITIAAGASVTLGDATIPGGDNGNTQWSGITCLGNATITLVGTNSVKGYNQNYSGLQPAPENTLLTIRGNGKLNAFGSDHGAGIGSCEHSECGNILIEGGEITANAGEGAGIGCGHGRNCGSITITGGKVNATSRGGAGIGCGSVGDNSDHCGDITISGGIVTASGGMGAGIGSGNEFTSCNAITITGGTVTATSDAGAGIGSGRGGNDGTAKSSCGNITISGGTVKATGGSKGAGIGSSLHGSCGIIAISGTAQGSATHGSDAPYDIGAGAGGTSGIVSINASNFSGTVAPAYAVPFTTVSFGLRLSAFTDGYGGSNEVSDVKAQSVTISGSQGSWTVTPTAPATSFSQYTSGLTAEIIIDPGETLTFTATNVSYEYQNMNYSNGTFIGTVNIPSGGIGATLNLGTVTLTKQ